MNYPTPYGKSDDLALENERLKALVKELKVRARAPETKLLKIRSMAQEAIALSERSLTRTFDGQPFPARLSAKDVLDVVEEKL